MAQTPLTLYLVDGHAQLYRAHHAHSREGRHATDGTPTGALYGFMTQMRSLRSRFKPELLACVFDPKGPTFREKEYAGYKAQRLPMPEELRRQIPLAFELCEGFGIPALQVEGYEADDVLATLAVQAKAQGCQVVIVSSDKDLLQLVQEGILVYDPFKEIDFDAAKVKEVKGLTPEQIPDWLGLMGDATDNIPGVAGVGEQTATKLLQEHGTLEQVLAHYQKEFKDRTKEILEFVKAHTAAAGTKEKGAAAKVKPPKGMKVVEAYLFAQAEQARASRELARLRLDAPVSFDLEGMRRRGEDRARLLPLLQRLDFRQFLREAGGEEQLFTAAEEKGRAASAARAYRLVDTPARLEVFARELARQKTFAVDTETTSIDALEAELVGFSFAWRKGEAWYLPVRAPQGPTLTLDAARAALRGPLEDAGAAKVGQDLKYDLKVLRRNDITLRGLAFDTMLAGWLLDPAALRHDLDALAYAHLQVRKTATESLVGKGKAAEMGLVPVEEVLRYACEDADLTWQLAEVLRPKLDAAGLTALLEQVEMPLIEVLADMELRGVRVDVEVLTEMSQTMAEQLAAQEEDIYKLAGEHFTINSPKQLGHILFQKLGLESLGKTATGQDATGEEVLQALSRKHELPKLVLDYRQLSKLKSTYVDALPGLVNARTGRIHAQFHQAGTETGRLSSSDPNLQNIPVRTAEGKSIRAAFIPGDAGSGWKMVSADYSQIELRILAHYSEDQALLAAFARNEDIHRTVAARIYGVAPEAVTRDQRAQAKTVNFGVLYGQTAYGLGQTLGIPQKEAQEIIRRFFDGFPRVRQCLDGIIAGARAKGYVTTILGRRRFVPQLKEKSQEKLGERIAVNTVFQGSAADLIKKAMVAIHRELREAQRGWQARLILQIHDELLFEAPADEVRDLTKLAKAKMEEALPLRVPLVVDVGVGEDWLSAKD